MTNIDVGIFTDNPDDSLRYLESVDAVKVIRCCECKFYKHMKMFKDLGGICDLDEQWERPDFFCADAEARS